MPQWAGSCWYFLRYLDPKNTELLAAKEKIDYWMPVDLYVGGAEHAVLHLLYSRFWHKVLFDIGVLTQPEPFQRLINQGMITSFAYQRPDKTLVPTDEVEEKGPDSFIEKTSGIELTQVIAKMSKSLKNVINPDDIIRDFGADSMRVYEMFMGPLQVSKPWSTSGISGVHRFLDRVWRLFDKPIVDNEPSEALVRVLHKTIKKVTHDTDGMEFNTAISQMMIFVNEVFKEETLSRSLIEPFVLLLTPYTPHLCEELWERLGKGPLAGAQPWPEYQEELTRDEEIQLVFQVNGKVRAKVDVVAGISVDEMKQMALDHPRIRELIEGKQVRKIIPVPGKLVNIVAN